MVRRIIHTIIVQIVAQREKSLKIVVIIRFHLLVIQVLRLRHISITHLNVLDVHWFGEAKPTILGVVMIIYHL